MFGAVGVWPLWSKRLDWRQEEMKEGSDEGERGQEKEGEGRENGGREKERREEKENATTRVRCLREDVCERI